MKSRKRICLLLGAALLLMGSAYAPEDASGPEEPAERTIRIFETGVFEGKEPLCPETEVPIDNLTMIAVLRREARDNEGYISADTSPRGTLLEEEALAPAA